ncbi:MBL fold metallo-hydrolase [Streptomyces sp. NPDC047108]|uniref:MBL fold metallo-hydrolase n=1 Tax=Streptomyces sp. NPDC047108 TaxID=3155025 RepID=UPI0033C82995
MQVTKWGHACARLEKDGQSVVIDPGELTEPEALDGADAVLITHEHWDHFDEGRLRSALEADPALHVWTIRSVAERLTGHRDRVTVVGDGDTFTAAGFVVEAHGTLHGEIHPAVPRSANTGFFLDGSVFHPGDALTVPDAPVDTLMLPVHTPWLDVADVVDYVAEVAPRTTMGVHDGLLREPGAVEYGRIIAALQPRIPYRLLAPGETAELATL